MIAKDIAIPDDQIPTLLTGYISQGLKNIEIADKFKVHPSQIGRWIKRFDIKDIRKLDKEIQSNLQDARNIAQVQNKENSARPAEEKDPDPIDDTDIDDSYKKLIKYFKFAKDNDVEIPLPTILQLLDKTDQLVQNEKEITTDADLTKKIGDMILNYMTDKYEPKKLEWLYD